MSITPLLLLIPQLAGGNRTALFEGQPGFPGSVVVVGSLEERPPELQDIQLLALEVSGRTRLTALRADLPQLRQDIPGGARIVLPAEGGSLYKYRRPVPGAGAAFGLFRVSAAGDATALFELPGTGPTGAGDPIPEKIAISRDGSAGLIASTPAAGGDLFELDLVGGTARNRTPHLAPIDFARGGLVLLDTWGAAVAEDGVYRFARDPQASAELVGLPAQRWFGPDIVASEDQSTVAFLCGDDVSRALVFTCQASGVAVQVSERPMRIPGAGFLPEDPSGPALALSTDGSWVAWRAEDSSREIYTHPTRFAVRSPDVHLTGPSSFNNTLNDTGVIAFFDRDSAVLVAGRRESNGIGRADLFRVDLASSGYSVHNLSGTSGLTQPPFDYGTLETGDGLFEVPGAPVGAPAFFVNVSAGAGRLLWVDAGGRASEILTRVKRLESVTAVGSYLVVGITRPAGVDDPLEDTLNLVQVPPDGLNPIVVRLPSGCHLTRDVGSARHSLFTSVLEFDTGERLGRLKVPNPNGASISPALMFFGPTVGLSLDGSVLATVKLGLEQAAFAWSEFGTQVIRIERGGVFLLPGQ